ncbi:MAG: SGNH/GDSL hydrolase family protein [Acidimicrobiia bacterium]|nr:SGNH/GDSL hydrolase family protein [Acidimicrobiia bacterium]
MLKRLAVRAVALGLGILVVLVIGLLIEGASWGLLRAKGKTTEAFGRRYHVNAHVRYRPWTGPMYRPYQNEVRTGLGTDRHGFIHNGDPSRDLTTKAPGVYRIFILGGSPVAGMWSGDVTIAGRLEVLLNAGPDPAGRRFEVVNAAMEGWNSSQELAMLSNYLPEFAPDLIIAINGFNDVFHAIRAPREGYEPNISGHLTQLANAAFTHTYSASGTLSQALGILINRSYVSGVFDEVGGMIRARTGAADLDPNAPPPAGIGPDPLRYYRRNVAMQMAVSRGLDFSHMAVLMPTVLASNGDGKPDRQPYIDQSRSSWARIDYWAEKEQLYTEARETFRVYAARHDDGRRMVVRDYSGLLDGAVDAYIDQSHYSRAGADAMARRLAEDMRDTILR